MRTMRRVALVLIGCVVHRASSCSPGSSSGLGCCSASSSALVPPPSWWRRTYVILVGPWQRRWGSTGEEVRRAMPGDELLPPGSALDHPRHHDQRYASRCLPVATPDRLRPRWLVQLRLDRQRREAERRSDRSALQRLAVGNREPDAPRLRAGGAGDPDRPSHPERWRCGYLVSPRRTHLRRAKPSREPMATGFSLGRFGTYVWTVITDPGAFVMEQKMLRTNRDPRGAQHRASLGAGRCRRLITSARKG